MSRTINYILILVMLATFLFSSCTYIAEQNNVEINNPVEIQDIEQETILEEPSNTEMNTYETDDFSINYPVELTLLEPTGLVKTTLIETKNFETDMINGNIKSGYVIVIMPNQEFNFETFDMCNYDYEAWEEALYKPDCLLSSGNTFLNDYTKGIITKTQEENVINYTFKSTSGRNNNIGKIIKTDDSDYVVLIAYRDYKDEELFNSILDSFKLK